MSGRQDLGTMFGSAQVDTFLGLPACDDLARLDAAAAILGVPSVTPYRSVGPYCADAPRVIRETIAPYAASAHHHDFDLGGPILADGGRGAVDCGDLAFDADDFAGNRAALRAAAGAILDAGAVPVVIGGDDSVPIPLIDAFAGRGAFTVVQVDAHIDWRDEVDGERYGLSSTMRRASEMAHVTRIVQVGQRGIGSARPADRADALAWGVEFCPAREVARHGVAPALERVPEGADVIVSLDIDGLDPSVVPGVIGRSPGGLDYWQTVELIHGIAARARLAGFALVEYMPACDVDRLGALVAARLVANVIGLVTRGG